MNNIFIKGAILSLAAFSANAFAEKIIITSHPVVLEKQGELYVVPGTYKVAKDFQYVVIDGKERACFLDKRPDLVNIDVVSINVQIGADRATWNCYAPDPTYFTIQR